MLDILDNLNEIQKKAVSTENKHVLILAGAGTGKTRTITSRIIHLIKNKDISPSNILAVTFTNKAANEMKERIQTYLQKDINMFIKTFHSFGAYILRKEAFLSERSRYFQIYDTEDSKKALKKITSKYNIEKNEINNIYKLIQTYKQEVEKNQPNLYYNLVPFKKIYDKYNDFLKKSNCFDFEDLIIQPIKIFTNYPMVLTKYQSQFKYILVDEYQDTNKSQFELLKLLIGIENHLMVVGDEDQSIYKFRGADINNILNFKTDFPDAEIIRLEENYRSTNNILKTANNVISNNTFRLGKNLYSSKDDGNKIILIESENEKDEAQNILDIINKNNYEHNKTAILYRTNNQSRAFEQVFNKNNIRYILVGNIRFFEREEIKDAVSILKWLINPNDRIAFDRFINKPSRGLGKKTLTAFYENTDDFNNLYEALSNSCKINNLSKKAADIFSHVYSIFKDKDERIKNNNLNEMLFHYLQETGLWDYYKKIDAKEKTEKIDNLQELLKNLEKRDKGIESITSFLEEACLNDDSNNKNNGTYIKLMTVHNAKGLEFENVFVAGIENNLFPHTNSINEYEEYEEERRLFYVALTRAKRNLIISYCRYRNLFGISLEQEPSIFISELPDDLIINNKLNYTKNKKIISFKEGDIVRYKDYGRGKIIKIKEAEGLHLAMIDFWDYAIKELIIEYSNLEKVD